MEKYKISNYTLAIFDLDGTIVKQNLLDFLCKEVGKEEESMEIDQLYKDGKLPGGIGLIRRINLLRGLKRDLLENKIKGLDLNGIFVPGFIEFIDKLQKNNITCIIRTGLMDFIAQIIAKRIGFDACFGVEIVFSAENELVGLEENQQEIDKINLRQPFIEYFNSLNIPSSQILAFGDTLRDNDIFEKAGLSFLISEKYEPNTVNTLKVKDYFEISSYVE